MTTGKRLFYVALCVAFSSYVAIGAVLGFFYADSQDHPAGGMVFVHEQAQAGSELDTATRHTSSEGVLEPEGIRVIASSQAFVEEEQEEDQGQDKEATQPTRVITQEHDRRQIERVDRKRVSQNTQERAYAPELQTEADKEKVSQKESPRSDRLIFLEQEVDKLLRHVNSVRGEYGLHSVVLEPRLLRAARERLQDMVSKNYFAHVSPDGVAPSDVVTSAGYAYRFMGENIAYFTEGSVEKLLGGWLESETHRANILSNKVVETGIAVAWGTIKGKEALIGVQIFASPK